MLLIENSAPGLDADNAAGAAAVVVERLRRM